MNKEIIPNDKVIGFAIIAAIYTVAAFWNVAELSPPVWLLTGLFSIVMAARLWANEWKQLSPDLHWALVGLSLVVPLVYLVISWGWEYIVSGQMTERISEFDKVLVFFFCPVSTVICVVGFAKDHISRIFGCSGSSGE